MFPGSTMSGKPLDSAPTRTWAEPSVAPYRCPVADVKKPKGRVWAARGDRER